MSNLFVNFYANASLASDAFFVSPERGGLFNEQFEGFIEDIECNRSSSCPLNCVIIALRQQEYSCEIIEMISAAVEEEVAS